jgi:hypothetical protein
MITAADLTLDEPDAFGAARVATPSDWVITYADATSRPFDDDWRAGWGPYATRGGDNA